MRIIKQIQSIYLSSKYVEPESKLGIFLSELKSRIKKENDFINYISSIKFWDFNKVSLWSFEEVLNYIDEILEKYSIASNEEINNNILLPLIKFIFLLIKNCYNREIFASFDNLQKIYLSCFNIEIKILIVEINLLSVENNHSLIIVNKLFYRTLHIMINFEIILMDLIHNDFSVNKGIINILEQIMNNLYRKWSNLLKRGRPKLNEEENKTMNDVVPFNIFHEIIFNKKNYKNPENFRGKFFNEYNYFRIGHEPCTQIYEKNLKFEKKIKYLLKDEIAYIICMNNFFFLVNEIVQISINPEENKDKIISLTKFILLGLNLYSKNNISNLDDDNINILSENYIQNYYNNILTIVTSPNFSLKLKSTFLKSGIYFMVIYDGYDNILFGNGLFHSFLNDLTHQNGNEMEVLTEKEGDDQEFLNVILKFVFNFKIFKEIPQNFFVKILELPKNKIYPYRIDNVIFALKKRKIFDENLVKNIIMPRLIYELENIEIPSNELKYNFNTEEKITINQRNLLIDRLFLVLIKIIKKSTNSNIFGNFELNLVGTFTKIFDIKNNKNLLTNIEFLPSIINLIYFYIKICNCFPSKIPTYINNNIFNLSIEFFQNYFPKCDGGLHLVFFMMYTICIHNEGKKYIKNNLEKIKILFENIFEILDKNKNYFFYNLFVLKDINKYELFSPCGAFIQLDGVSEIIKIIFSELKKFMEKMSKEITEIKIKKSTNINLNEKLFFIETKRTFIDEFFSLFNEKNFETFKKNNIDIDILSILKLYLDILINPITLYSLRSNFIVLKPIILLAKNYPEFTMNKIYDRYNEILNNNFDLEKIQIYKMIYSLQKIIETIFTSLYQKSENINFINIADKYSFLYAKFITKFISLNSKLSFYMNTLDDRQLLLNSKYCIKLLSKDKDPQFREMLIKISYKVLSKLLPHMTNPNLLIIDEDNYQNIKCPVELNQSTYLEILSGSFFTSELFKQENKIYNSLLASVEFFYILGKKIKPKVLCNFQLEDISRIKNNMKLGFIFSNIIKYFYENFEIKVYSNTEDTLKNILIYIFLFNYMNLFLFGKINKNISSILLYYFIKYDGIKNIFKITKQLFLFCKEEYAKKELPIIEIILIKSLWNTLIGALLLLIKYSFYLHDSFYTLLILENNLTQNFSSMKEFDAWVKFLILNNFVEVFFDKNDFNNNINIIKDLETYSNELTRTMFILFDNCCRIFYEIDNIKDEKINLNELYEKGYFSYEIMQVIQEGKFTNENIIKAIDEYRQNEIDNENEKNEKDNINEEKYKDNEKNKDMEEEKDKEKDKVEDKEKEENNEIKNMNSALVNNINPEKKEKIIKKTINKNLSYLEKIDIKNDESFQKNINELFPEKKNSNKDENNSINYSKENFLNSLLYIYSTLESCNLSFRKINEMKKMNIKYRIKSFEKKEDLLPYLKQLLDMIKKNQENNVINEEEKTKKELTYLMFMNYSIIRYKTLTNFYETVDINKYIDFIYENNLIENSSNAIKDIIEKKEKINFELKKKLIYEHFLRIYILFCFLEYNKKNFEKEKKIFLESFFYLINESKDNEIYILNEAIMILSLQIINEFFNFNDKSQEILYEYLSEKKMFERVLELKFNKIDAISKLDDNQLKYFVTLEECFKQFIFKIFSEKNLFGNLLQSIFKYILANINPENDEIELDNFIDLCSDYIKIDNCDIFINSIKAFFDIIEKEEKNNNKIYLVRLKQENKIEVEKLKEEIKKGETKINVKNKENNEISENIDNNFEEKIKNIKFNWSERNKILFNILLNHICKTSELINEDIFKREKYQKFSRNYLFDLDTTLSGLNCILHTYPSFIYLLFLFKYKENPENNFIKYLIKKIFPILNYCHFCISWPEHITYIEDLDNNFSKERKNSLKCYNNTPNSYQSYFEYFRNVNIIASIIHSITYKRRNMNEIELTLINECRKKTLDEINLILICLAQKIKNDFDLLNKNDDLLSVNVIYFKSCLTILFSMSEFIDSSDIFSQFDAFEIANLIFSKKYNIIKSITNILKNMKLDEKNGKFHQIGIKYLNQLFKFIKIKKQKKQIKEFQNNNNINNSNIEDNKSIISNKSKKREVDSLLEFPQESSEENEGLYTEDLNIVREEEEIEEEEEELEDELNQENILNDVEEDLLNLANNEEEDEEDVDSNELLNNLENPIEANNLNLQIIQNEEEIEEEEENNNNLVNNERILGIHNMHMMNLEDNYNEENILFYEYNTEVIHSLNKQKLKAEEFQFYEDFITFPFLLFRTNSKNELIYFKRAKINVDIFCNLDKIILNKANNMFLYYYLFPFDLQYNKYFNFVFTGFKNKTLTGYFNEINKILSDFMSMFSKKNEQTIMNLSIDILTKLKKDGNIIKESNKIIKKENEPNVKDNSKDKDKDKNKESELVEEKSEDIQMIIEKEKEKEKNEKKKEKNNEAEFLLELPPDLREDILRDLDPSIIPTLPQEMQNEYIRIMSRANDLSLIPLNLNLNKQQTDIIIGGDNNNNLLKKNYKLRKLRYKREYILKIFYKENNISNEEEENNILLNIFDDQFLENLILYNLKSILYLKLKKPKKPDEYASILKRLIYNENLRYKIIDILLNLWICDTQNIFNLIKNSKIPQNNNNFLNNLFYFFFQLGLSEDYIFNYYENFFIYFAKKYQKYMKKFFLQTSYNQNGEYVLEEKIYEITPNSKNLKQLLNIQYNKGENVLGNLLDLILVKSNSSLKTIFAIQIFTVTIQNCLKDADKEKNNIIKESNSLNISDETIYKMLDLFNNFEVNLYTDNPQKTNNPTSILIEMINDEKIYKILLDALMKRIRALKESITKEMDDFLINKKIDIILYNKILPNIILFKLVKFINSASDDFNEKITQLEKNKNIIEIWQKKNMYKKLKHFIKEINEILFSCWEQLNNLLFNINIRLKENQEIILPKLNRLIPYLETFITLSHLQFISTYSPILDQDQKAFIFEKKFESNPKSSNPASFNAQPQSSLPLVRLNSKNEVDSFVEFFYEFCEKNKKIINYILRQYPKMFTNELIKKISPLLDLENKKTYFQHSLKKLPANKKYLKIQVRRNGAELFADSFEALINKSPKDIRGNLMIFFENEEAVDRGGVKREWLTILSKEMFNPNYMLFTLAKNGTTYTINSDSGKFNDEHLRYFEFIGKIIAKAIFDGMMLDCYFTRVIYKLISGTPISYHDMEDYDPVYYNSIKWLLENDFTEAETFLTYSVNHDDLGVIQTVDLIENGRNVEVTEKNKFDYVQRLCSFKLYESIKLQIEALLKGFYNIIPQNLISIFNHRELELVISGMPTINIQDWKNNTIYENYNEESNVIKNFWEIIEFFDNDERAEFLQFVTGSAKVPLEGFCALQGIGGINKFKISKVFDTNFDRLPTAHTCTNQLDLPDYPTKEILNERLRLAIKEGKNSFGFI